MSWSRVIIGIKGSADENSLVNRGKGVQGPTKAYRRTASPLNITQTQNVRRAKTAPGKNELSYFPNLSSLRPQRGLRQ